jgi:ribose-phosphate pyrophosphokinase
MMKIYSRSGPVAYKAFTFSDGQPHVEIQAYNIEDGHVWIEAPIRSGQELLEILVAKDALDSLGVLTSLNIRYLLGARMDRRIARCQPFTLQVISRLINGAGFKKIRVLDPHSEAGVALLDAEPMYPVHAASCVLGHYNHYDTVVVAPDAGAEARVERLLTMSPVGPPFTMVRCKKTRETTTGKLSGFTVLDKSAVQGRRCLIMDDLCDGGGTFVGLAEKLHEAGALSVALFVTHGIFSRGTKLEGIDTVYTTDSYKAVTDYQRGPGPIVIRVDMNAPIFP